MSWRASSAMLKHEWRVLRSDPSFIVFVLIMPLGMIYLMRGLFAGTLAAEGYVGANGSEFAVPGLGVAFAAFGVGYSGFAFFREHGWGTWERLRASQATSLDIMIGKVVPMIGVTVAQLGLLFLLSGPLFDLRVDGSWLAIAVLIVMLSTCLGAFGVLVTAISRTSQQLNAIGSVGGMVLAIMGGAFVPLSVMPGWAQDVAPAIPTYWAMRGFRDVVLDDAGLTAVVLPTIVLAAFTVAFAGIAATRFRFEETKVYYG